MHFLFIDESGSPLPSNKVGDNPHFILGGIVIPENQWKRFKEDLDRIKTEFSVVGEIKWRYFAPEKFKGKEHSLSHLSTEDKEKLRAGLYSIIAKYKSVKLLSVVCDVAAAYWLPYVNNADQLYEVCYKQITERFQYYLQDVERVSGQIVNGIVVCDHRAPKDDKRLRELHHSMLNTPQINISKYSNLIEGLFIAPSHLSVGIQFADIVAGAIYRAYSASDHRFYDQVVSSFRTSPGGELEGYGIIRFPKVRK